MIPLTRPNLPDLSSIHKKMEEMFRSGMITEFKFTREFEDRCARFLGVKHVVAVNSGTSALLLTLKCMDLKGEVILPSFTFTSGGHTLLWNNLKPVFVDVDPGTFNVDPDVIEKKITKKTSAIMPTHVFGNPCDIRAIGRIAKKHKLKVIYDAAHAFGARYNKKSVAQFGDAAIYSLTPTKLLTTAEGGLIATNNRQLAHKLQLAKHNGDSFNRNEEFLGLSARMSEPSAILGIEGLKILRTAIKERRAKVARYKEELASVAGISFQEVLPNAFSVYKDLAIVIDKKKFGASRDQLLAELKKNNIQTKAYFDPPLHQKKVYVKYKNVPLPETNRLARAILDVPLYSHMPNSEIMHVCRVIKNLYKKNV
ncbi:MAG: DegT/DnrJ/EryC1/StrS family aminotransferase [Parcubacteria group bacterium]|nr:DegT/DnrJ/EryC1/StrS family aminotransferase [Parcubacteria group bacterium]